MPKNASKKSKPQEAEPSRIIPEKNKRTSLCEPDWKKECTHFDVSLYVGSAQKPNFWNQKSEKIKHRPDEKNYCIGIYHQTRKEVHPFIRSSANSIEERKQPIFEKLLPDPKGIRKTIIHQKQVSSHDIQEKRTLYQSIRKAQKTNASCSIGGSYHRPTSSLGVIDNSLGKEFKNIDLSIYEKQKKTMNQLNSITKKIKQIIPEEETGKENEQNQSLFSIAEDLSSSDCSKSNTTIIHLGSKSSTPSEEVGMKHNSNAPFSKPQQPKELDLSKKAKVTFQPKTTLKSHLDSCRNLIFTTDCNYLASVSEDCLLKIWKTSNILNSEFGAPIEPYFTFRGHTGPLFTLSASHYRKGNTDAELIYTAGLEGVIRVWGIPNYEIDPYSKTNGKNYCIGVWASHKDVIWQLVHHPTDVSKLNRVYCFLQALMEQSSCGRSLIST
jgi:hypothetical protein